MLQILMEIDEGTLDSEGKIEDRSCKRLKIDDSENDRSPINTTLMEEPTKLSKRQLKKLQKKELWLQRKPEKRAREKAKQKQKKLEAKLNNIDLGPSRYYLKKCTMANSSCNIHVVIDLSFDEYMNDKEIGKCIKQILRCYSLNRRAKNPMQLHVTDFNGKTKEEMSKHTGYENWDLNFHEASYLHTFKNEDIIYLTSESDNVLTSLENNKVYIIGGLVDHNTHKGLCHRLAEEKQLQHGQLPIGEYLEMKTRKVLTIDHVFEILLGVSEGKTWKDAFLSVLPARKGAMEKNKQETIGLKSATESVTMEEECDKDNEKSNENAVKKSKQETSDLERKKKNADLKEESNEDNQELTKNLSYQERSIFIGKSSE